MADNFPRAVDHTLRHEGGYVDHPADPGGATNRGITLATYRAWTKRPNATKEELRGSASRRHGRSIARTIGTRSALTNCPTASTIWFSTWG